MKKVLITGGAGFIGSQLSNQLINLGFDVYVVDKLVYHTRDYLSPKVIFIEADISETSTYSKLLNEVELVIHLAASGNVVESISNPVNNFENNVRSTISLLEALRHSECNKLFFSSTGGALVGTVPPPVSEFSLPEPISPYGASKLACEGYIKSYAICYGLQYTIFRFGNVIGPNCVHKSGVIQKFYDALSNDENLKIFGDVSRDFIFSGDIVEILHKSIGNIKCQNETILLATGVETRIVDLARLMLSHFPASKSQIINREGRLGEVKKNFADIAKFRSIYPEFKFKPIEDSVAESINFLNGKY